MADQRNSRDNSTRRTEPDATGRKSSPGLDTSARDPKDVKTSGAEGGSGIAGQGMRLKDESKQKGEVDYTKDPMRRAEASGAGNWSGRDGQRGTHDTSAGERGSGDSANQIDQEYEDS